MEVYMIRSIICALSLLLCEVGASAHAQEFRGTITGEVTDTSGAPVAGAKVIGTSLERNQPVETVTNSAGRYIFPFLLPGKYQLSVEKEGFTRFTREGIEVNSADRLGVNITLQLGTLTETVTVSASAPALQTETASRTALVENRVLENVPTNGRNLYQLQYTLPGVIKTSTYWGSMELYAFGNINGVSISGGRSGENETLIDGVSNTRGNRGVVLAPSLNSTQEFTLRSNTYDAQFGRIGGGVTAITIKSGTNRLHGQLFEFLKNDKLNANDWIANKEGEERSAFKNNTFGFELDGPVWIPKLFDGRNRAFFMVSLEALRERGPSTEIRTLPTAEQLQGDFSNLKDNQGRVIRIYDPATVRLANGVYVRDQFPGNRIPANRINPVAAKVAAFYPRPNRPGGADGQQNYAVFNPARNSYDAWLGKMDFRLGDRHILAVRYGQTPWENFARVLWGNNAAEPSGEAPSTRVSRNWGWEWTYTISPALVFNLRGGLARYEGFSGNVFAGGFDPRQLDFPDSLVSQFTTLQFPRFNLVTYSELGATQVTNYEIQDTYSIQPNLSLTRGQHFIKTGAEFRLYNSNRLQPGAAAGNYTFDKRWTQTDPLRADALSGNEFASFLLGLPSSGSVDRNIDPAYQYKYYAVFAQDDWRVKPRLTLNLGLRWDYETPIAERHNRMIRGFAFDQPSPIADRVSGLTLKGGLLFAGSSGEERLAFKPDRNNFQPRVGMAWQIRDKWVMRAGYGWSYLGQSSSGSAAGFSRPTPLIASTDGNITPAMTLSNPFPASLYPNGLLQPIGSSLGLSTNLGQSVSAQFLDRPLPYSHQFSFGFQRELPGGWLAEATYVGNLTRKLPVSLNQNFIPREILESRPVAERSAYFTEQIANPMAGLLPGTGLNGARVARQQLLFAYPQYTQVVITDVPIGRQSYHALQSSLTRRFSQGLATTVAYTFSKTLEAVGTLNNQDVNLNDLTATKLEQRLYQFNLPHKLAVVVSYELPFGRGKRFGHDLNKIANGLIGGWNLNTQWVKQSGFPFDYPNAGQIEARSARLNDSERDKRSRTGSFDPSEDKWFDTSLFPNRAQAPFTLRNFPTRFPDVRSPSPLFVEISAFKEISIKERVRWQIRIDFQNAFNYPFFGALQSNDVTNTRFAQLRADITNEPRRIVGVMKLTF